MSSGRATCYLPPATSHWLLTHLLTDLLTSTAKAGKAAPAKAKAKAAAKPAKQERAKTAYMLYCDSRRDKVKAENPDAGLAAGSQAAAPLGGPLRPPCH